MDVTNTIKTMALWGRGEHSLFIFGVISCDIVEEDDQKEQCHPQNVGKYSQLDVCNHDDNYLAEEGRKIKVR